jgi:hypothetical protein
MTNLPVHYAVHYEKLIEDVMSFETKLSANGLDLSILLPSVEVDESSLFCQSFKLLRAATIAATQIAKPSTQSTGVR